MTLGNATMRRAPERSRIGSRHFVSASATAMLVAMGTTSVPAVAQSETTVTIMAAQVHRDSLEATGSSSGGVNVIAAYEEASGNRVDFSIQTVPGLGEALPRLGVLSNTTEDIIYVPQADSNTRLANFLVSLDDYIKSSPIAGLEDRWPAGIIAASTVDDELHILPVRCGTYLLWANEQLLADRGMEAVATTPEELLVQARELTFVRDNGERVFGFVMRGDRWSLPEDLSVLVRMFGGDLITEDFEVVINQAEAVEAITMLKQMYQEDLLPSNWSSLAQTQVTQLFRDERAAIIVGPSNYGPQYNDGESRVSGQAAAYHVPLKASLWTDEVTFSPSFIWFWGIGILNGSQDKDAAYDFISYVAQPDVQSDWVMRNGNGACTFDVLEQQAGSDPSARLALEVMQVSRPSIPAHPRMAQARDMISETVQNIVVNNLDVQSELDALAQRIGRILN